VLNKTEKISDFGGINWNVYLSYVFTMFFCYLCCFKGVKLSGKIALYTGSLPFIMLFILILRGIFLPGCFSGLKYLFTPDFSKIWSL
jgi:SNF family Na+-dependent transporter